MAGVGAALEECAQFGALFGIGGSVAVDEVSWLEPDNGGDDEAMGVVAGLVAAFGPAWWAGLS